MFKVEVITPVELADKFFAGVKYDVMGPIL